MTNCNANFICSIISYNMHNTHSQLLNNFFESAANVLSTRGEIHIALCDGQGG